MINENMNFEGPSGHYLYVNILCPAPQSDLRSSGQQMFEISGDVLLKTFALAFAVLTRQ